MLTREQADLAAEEAGKKYFREPTDHNLLAFERASASAIEFDLAPKLETAPRIMTDAQMMQRDNRVIGARPIPKSKSLSTPSADLIKEL